MSPHHSARLTLFCVCLWDGRRKCPAGVYLDFLNYSLILKAKVLRFFSIWMGRCKVSQHASESDFSGLLFVVHVEYIAVIFARNCNGIAANNCVVFPKKAKEKINFHQMSGWRERRVSGGYRVILHQRLRSLKKVSVKSIAASASPKKKSLA